MTLLIVYLVLWLVCALTSYLLMRRDQRGIGGKWTQLDRVFCATFCLLYGPIMLMAVALFALARRVSNTSWAQQEARW